MSSKSAFRSSLGQAIADARANIITKPSAPALRQMSKRVADPNMSGTDGIDHILIGKISSTDLGKALNHNMPYFIFQHSVAGKFPSINNFWQWAQSESRDAEFHTLVGGELAKFTKSGRVNLRSDFVNCKILLADAIWQRMYQHKVLLDAFKESTLPFDMYFMGTGDGRRRERVASMHYQIHMYEELREIARTGYNEPTLEMWLLEHDESPLWDLYNNRTKSLYASIAAAPVVQKPVPAPKVPVADHASAGDVLDDLQQPALDESFSLSAVDTPLANAEVSPISAVALAAKFTAVQDTLVSDEMSE